jgi:anti-sigma regulatory factor (Ser/Thr protein kinase)
VSTKRGGELRISVRPNTRASLTIENRLSELARVERWLSDLMGRWALSDRAVFALDLVINEAVTNVINHAYSDALTHQITITLTDAADRIAVGIRDDGEAFDPFGAPPLESSQNLAQAPIGGRGIHLIKSYSAAHDYRRIEGRNHLTLLIPKVD